MNRLNNAICSESCLSKKEEFSDLERCYDESPEEFCREINGVLVSLFAGSYNADVLRRAVNTIGICVYFDIENENLIPVFKNALDAIHVLTYKTSFDTVISAQIFKANNALRNTVNSCYMKGPYKELHYKKLSSDLPVFSNALDDSEITNVTRALYYEIISHSEGLKVSADIKNISKAMLLRDQLCGDSIDTFYEKNDKEEAARKTAFLHRVGLGDLADLICGYYDCKTGNEKRRYITGFKNEYISYSNDIVTALDLWLHKRSCIQ